MRLSLLLLSLLLSAFHAQLPVADGQSFDFPSGKLDSSSLSPLQHGSVDSSGTLTLDSSAGGDAVAFYSDPITLFAASGRTVLSFASFFTFSSNATSGNGTIAFVLVPNVSAATTDWVATARKTFSVEFNTSCSAGLGFPDPDGSFYGDHGFSGGGWGGYGGGGGWRGRGPFGGIGGFQVVEYANNIAITNQSVGGYGPNYDGPLPNGSAFCSQHPPETASPPIFQYEVVVEYNASTETLWVGTPSCGVAIARTTQFASQDLSSIITSPVHAGFLVSGGAVFNITQWNFTNNVNTSSITSLALSAVDTGTPTSSGDGSSSPDSVVGGGGRRGGGSGLKKGYVIAFSILGAGIGVAAVLLVCCLCVRRRRRAAAAAATEGKYVGKRGYAGTIPESAVVFDAKKPTAPPAKVALVERDTMPLYSQPNSTSTGAASWLKPVQPR